MQYLIVDEHGNVINELRDGDRILRKSSADAFKRTLDNRYIDNNSVCWEFSGYVKVNVAELALWIPKLSTTERQLLFDILPYVQYTSCAIMYRNHRPCDYEGLIELSGLKKTAVYETVKELRKKNIISVVRNSTTQFYICPWIVTKGMAINKTLKTMFCNYKVQSLSGRRWGDMKEFQR